MSEDRRHSERQGGSVQVDEQRREQAFQQRPSPVGQYEVDQGRYDAEPCERHHYHKHFQPQDGIIIAYKEVRE